jgi:hypothetical protein
MNAFELQVLKALYMFIICTLRCSNCVQRDMEERKKNLLVFGLKREGGRNGIKS